MASITSYYTPSQAAVESIKAGVDIILMPADLEAAADGVMQAVESGELTWERIEESVIRILALKINYGII